MNDQWRYSAVSITKYNPLFRDENGYYKKEDWLGFFQIGKTFNGEKLTFESYLLTESKYLQAAAYFFEYHSCKAMVVKNIEKNDYSDYTYNDREELILIYNKLTEGAVIPLADLPVLIKLILRELIWAEVYCEGSDDIALRFGRDYYMYFNSGKNMSELFRKTEALGLFVY